MDLFRYIADPLHLIAIILLIRKIHISRNCIGLSYRTQEIFLVTFCLRYLDLFMYFISVYNTWMKVLYISATCYTIYLIRKKRPFCGTYDPACDDFQHYHYLYPGVFLMTLIVHTRLEIIDFLWSYSLWLEAVAFIPQIIILNRMQTVENMTSNYIACLGMYRFFYLLSWMYRYYMNHHIFWTQVLAGILQTGVYGELLYYYFKSVREGKPRMELPLKV